MIANDISILGIAEAWLKTSLYIQGLSELEIMADCWQQRIRLNWIIKTRSISKSNNIIETNNHRIAATLIEDYLIIVAYAPVVTNHQSKKSIDDYINFIIEVQEIF
ncbi:unnamed protein product [Blepharisma stoltei]|uniref:Uncharacterized protein n=1 Tax=Blepharisma stoltei TaxID=1481888 RepID=A0AAU9IZ96_9CILI|nr:unnamed protein product [Blepharisma stoltei]